MSKAGKHVDEKYLYYRHDSKSAVKNIVVDLSTLQCYHLEL